MLTLIIAGEAVFALPFHLARFFRPTVLDVFQLTNTELGVAQAAYGVLAMLSYVPGGPLADRFPARKLIAMSLWSTAAGGVYMMTLPGYQGAILVWGFYGVTTILFFWAALIRATRNWGGTDVQGRAYGLLDGGRGGLQAVLASVGVWIFAAAFPAGYEAASFEDKQEALRIVILGYTVVTALAGVLAWFLISDDRGAEEPARGKMRPPGEPIVQHVMQALRLPAVWLQAAIIVCAYVGYKGFDFYSLFAFFNQTPERGTYRRQAPPTIKVCMNYLGGYKNSMTFVLPGIDTEAMGRFISGYLFHTCTRRSASR